MRLLAENESLRGQMVVVGEGGGVPEFLALGAPKAVTMQPSTYAVAARGAVGGVVRPVAVGVAKAPPVSKPVQTWSVVVLGKGVSSKDVLKKVVGPTLGVQVHGVQQLKDGGAVIRTPSVAEREKVVANSKFAEIGLDVLLQDKLGPKVVVQRVYSEISPDEFMNELYEMNLNEKMTLDRFK